MTVVPARLFVGQNHDLVVQAVEQYVSSFLCEKKTEGKNKDYCSCRSCRQMKQRQHRSMTWINPEKDYTLGDIEIVFEKICFALDEYEHHFFILDKAQTLTVVVANKLLKVIEEPPQGYHFLLLTPNEKVIIQTILSRCLIVPVVSETETVQSTYIPLLLTFFFDDKKLSDPVAFEQELKKQKLTDTESEALLQELIGLYAQELSLLARNNGVVDEKKVARYMQITDFLQEKMLRPPQSGSSDIFWKYLYVTFPRQF